MSFKTPKMPPVEKPPPPPSPPSAADASRAPSIEGDSVSAVRSLVNTTGTGLARKANTAKRSLIGGA